MAKNHKASSLKDEGSSESMDSSTSQDGINFQNYDGLRNNNPHLVTNSSNYNGYLGNRGEEVSESSLAFAIGNPVESPLSRLQNQLEHLGFSSNLNGTGHQGLLTSTPFGNFPNDLVLQVAHHHHQQQQQQQQQRRHQEQQQQQIKYQSSTSPSGTTTMTEGEWYKCHICPFRSLDNQEYAQHMGTHFSCKCSQCPYQSRTEGRLKRHIQKFHSENPPENWVTPQASSKNDDYSDNSNYDDGGDGPEGSGKSANGSKHPNGVKKARKHKCKQCPFVTTDKEELWEHIRIHMKPDKILSCTECKFITEYKHHLEYHIRNHFGSKPFTCSKCNYICVNKSMLNSHMKSHSNVYQYRCRDCSYATKYCHSLKLHLRKYKHEPATVLNLDGSPNPFPVIDVYGTRRGPRPKKKTPESKLTVSSNGNACNGSGSGSGGGPSATKTTTPPMTTFSSSPTAAPVASSAVPTSCNSQEVNAMISPFSQMMSNQQSAISPLNFLNNKGCIPSFISTLSPFFYPPFPNFPPGLVSSPHFGGLVSSQQHPPALQISPTTTVLPISTMRLPTTNTNTNTTSVLDGSNHSVPLPLPPPPLLPSPLSSPMSSPISPITPTAMITMDSTNNNSITLSSPKQTRKQSSHNSNTHIVPLKCSYCDLVFEKREDLYAAHLKTHIKKEREVAMKRKESESSSEKESESLSDEGSPAKETKISSEVAIWEQIRALLDKVKDLPTSRQVMCPEIAMAMNCINEKSLREYLAPSEEEIEEDPGDNDDDDDDREMQIEQMDFKWGNESGPLDLSKRISSPGNKEGKASNTDRHRRRKGIAVRRVN